MISVVFKPVNLCHKKRSVPRGYPQILERLTKEHLNNHKKTHTSEGLLKCSLVNCNYECIQKVHLNNHNKIHTREGLLKCTWNLI